MIEVRNLSKQFGEIAAVRDVSFNVSRGEVLGFLGPNGAGKSTTMRMLTGFLTPSAGTVTVDGLSLTEESLAIKRKIGYLPEGAPLYGDMTTGSFLRFIAEIRGYRGAEQALRVADVVAKVHLDPVLNRPIETLSKGFKRRVGLAQAIIHDPEILILDEPTDGLDPIQKHEVRELIRSMSEDKVIILSTHILEEVDAVCTRAVIIADGRVVADGTPDDLAARASLHNSVSLVLRGPLAETATQQLSDLPGVASVSVVEQSEEHSRLQLQPKDGGPILHEVSHAVHAAGWEVEELLVARGQLEEVFRLVVAGDGAGEG